MRYEWEYTGKMIVYYLTYGDYGLAVYGYGVEGPEIDTLVRGLR